MYYYNYKSFQYKRKCKNQYDGAEILNFIKKIKSSFSRYIIKNYNNFIKLIFYEKLKY